MDIPDIPDKLVSLFSRDLYDCYDVIPVKFDEKGRVVVIGKNRKFDNKGDEQDLRDLGYAFEVAGRPNLEVVLDPYTKLTKEEMDRIVRRYWPN